ncbi:zinc finger transcription factor ace1 [Fusarium sp. NRRL 25303]|nr:zinc finger transcription factor ace1 [Fusarium sp. NRRL 25303]
MSTIADRVSACLQEFNSLCNSPAIWTDSVLGKAKDIFMGQLTPWDQELPPAEFSDDDSDDGSLTVDVLGPSELSQIFAAIVEDINCLFRLSVSIHNPSPHDRFKKACLTDTSSYEPFDVQHVCNKLSKAPRPIAERLGKAISRRRQYFKYRELHHEKLASGLELDGKDQMQSTVASSLPKRLKVNESISLEKDVDDASDTRRSQTSWATSAANPERRKIPPLPAEAENGPFECPFCFMMISITSRIHWKKHVFSDLFPYVCVELGCPAPDQDFQRRHQWAGHVKKHHWKTWTCKLGCNETFVSLQGMKGHLAQKHSETAELTHLVSLLAMCERPKSEYEPADCPLCGERQSSFKQYQRHVGRHQEDLALFALPHLPGEEDDKNEASDSDSEGKQEAESEEQDELQKASSYVTRISNESGDEVTDVPERSIRYAREEVFAPVFAIDEIVDGPGLTLPESRLWKCPVLTCRYHHYGWLTEDDRDRHYRQKHSETPAMYECMFKPCPYKSKREANCKQHMEKAHGWTYVRRKKSSRATTFDTGKDTAIEQPRTPLDTDSADESSEQGEDSITHHRIEMISPVETRESFYPANVDVLHLRYKKSLYTLRFPRHDIRDGKLRVSKIREIATGMTHVPESLRHLIELSYNETKLLIDGTPIRNYGVSRGDTIKVEAPQFRKSGPFSGTASDDPVLDNGKGIDGNMGHEGKAERDERRAEFSSELRQRAMVESFGYQKAPASSNPQDVREETDPKRNNVRKKTKTGCLTCRKRRIKCDEGRPTCNNCIKSERHCEGYNQRFIFRDPMGAIQGVPAPEIESDLEIMDTRYASGPSQPPAEAGRKGVKSSTPGIRCATCALQGKEVWVIPGRCCGYCGTQCVEEDNLDVHDSFAANVNDNEEWFPLFTETGANGSKRPYSLPEGPKKEQVSCSSLSINGYCVNGAKCPFMHDVAMIRNIGSGDQHNSTITFWSDDEKDGT